MVDKPDTEPDGPLRPQVIDLDAEEIKDEAAEPVVAEPVAEASAPPPDAPPPKSSAWASGRLWGGVAAAGLLLFAGAWLYRDFGQRFWPSDTMTALVQRVEALDAGTRAANDQVARLGASVDALTKNADALASGLTAAQSSARDAQTAARDALAAIAAAKDASAGLGSRIDAIDKAIAATAAEVAALKAAPPSVPADGAPPAGGGVDPVALAALEQRVAALETALAEVKAERATAEPDQNAAALLSQALSDLKAKFAAGAPFAEELGRIARMVPAAPGLETLQPHAAAGLPNAQGLAEELAALAPSLPAPKAEPEPAEPGYWDWIMGQVGSIVTVRALGDPDWRGVAERAHRLAVAGELAQAANLLDEIEGDIPQALNDWRAKVRARLAAERALQEVSDAVLRQLAAIGATP